MSDSTQNTPQAERGFEAVIGLEVHCQLATQTKIFCSCATSFGAAPNSQTCPVCLGLPGALPVLNQQAVWLAVRAALGLECAVQPVSIFSRKNYFYPDLPKGYQITQFDRPYALGGQVCFELNGTSHVAPLIRIHMEEDAGKSMHGTGFSSQHSLVDLNRAGTPLIEIVSTPCLHTAEAAVAYVKSLHAIVTSLEVSDGNMERGNFRCDANVSVRPLGSQTLGTRVELKNLNSFRFLGRAIQYEIERQIEVIEGGGQIKQQTRLWDQERSRTVLMREKEEAHDYRYFPEPDLRPLVLSEALVRHLRETLPELPRARAQRYQQQLGLSAYDAEVLTADPALCRYFEAVMQAGVSPKLAANWVTGELLAALNREGASWETLKLSPETLADIVKRLESGELTGRMAKMVFDEVLATGATPAAVIEARGLKQVSDSGALEQAIAEVLAANPKELSAYRGGKDKLFGFFVGQVMKRTGGQANPAVLNDLLKRALQG